MHQSRRRLEWYVTPFRKWSLVLTSLKPVYGPSAIAARQEKKFRFIPGEPGYVTPTAIEDPATLLPIWKKAAANAKAAGFDGVEGIS